MENIYDIVKVILFILWGCFDFVGIAGASLIFDVLLYLQLYM